MIEGQNHLLGQALALGAAITWAGGLVLFKRSGEHFPPLALNMYKNVIGLVFLLLTLPLLDAAGWEPFRLLPIRLDELCLLMLSGIIGIALADTLFFRALNLIGVGLISIVDCCYTPYVILFSFLLLGNELNLFHYVGAALIIGAVLISTRHTLPVGRTRGQIVSGVLLAMFAIAMMAGGIVVATPVLEKTGLVWATTVRMLAGTFVLVLLALLGPGWRRNWIVFRPSRVWKYAFPATFLGSYLSMTCWVGGFKYTYPAVAGVLNQTTVIFASILAAIFLKERFGMRKRISVVLALAGVLTVQFSTGLTAWLLSYFKSPM